MTVSVLIVDDHSGFRRRARRLLEAEGYAVVGEAGDGADGVAAARELAPDLVLLDVNLPDTDGFAVARGAHRRRRGAGRGHHLHPRRGRRRRPRPPCGARGFVPKDELSGAALDAVLAER